MISPSRRLECHWPKKKNVISLFSLFSFCLLFLCHGAAKTNYLGEPVWLPQQPRRSDASRSVTGLPNVHCLNTAQFTGVQVIIRLLLWILKGKKWRHKLLIPIIKTSCLNLTCFSRHSYCHSKYRLPAESIIAVFAALHTVSSQRANTVWYWKKTLSYRT